MASVKELLWRAGWIVLFELHLLPKVKRATREVRQQRLETCRTCPIFVKEFSRCGPIKTVDPVTGQKVTLGCKCFMKIKSKVACARCWAREQGLTIGWNDTINGSSTDNH